MAWIVNSGLPLFGMQCDCGIPPVCGSSISGRKQPFRFGWILSAGAHHPTYVWCMARLPRMSVPGKIHHIMAHAIDGLELFRDKQDRREFLRLFAEGLKRTRFRCYGWSLMDNHYHLVVRTNDLHLCELMRTLNSCYARYYNKKYGRRGYLFRERYRSVVCSDMKSAMRLLRYVHLNPVKAGMVHSLKELAWCPWTGHAALMGTMTNDFQDASAVLGWFGDTPAKARQRYEAFVHKKLQEEDDAEFEQLIQRSNAQCGRYDDYACWVIGDEQFVQEVIRRDTEHRMRLSRLRRAGWTLAMLAEHVAARLGLDAGRLGEPARRGAYARGRSAFAAVGYRQMGVPQTRIARFLNVAPATVSCMVKRGHELVTAIDIDSALDE